MKVPENYKFKADLLKFAQKNEVKVCQSDEWINEVRAGWLVSYNRPFFSDVQRRVIPVDKCFIFFPVRRG